MKSKRTLIRQRDREKLTLFIRQNVHSQSHRTDEEEALLDLTMYVQAYVTKQFDQADMQILHKYKQAVVLRNIRTPSDNWYARIQLTELNPTVMVPKDTEIDIDHKSPGFALAQRWHALRKARQQEEARLQEAFFTIMNTAKSIEELAEFWPEVPQILNMTIPKSPELCEAEKLVQQNLCERGVLTEGCE